VTRVRPATRADLPLVGPIEDACDSLFVDRFGALDWPAASTGEERVAEPGFLLVAVEATDGGVPRHGDTGADVVVGFAHVVDLAPGWHLEQIAVLPDHGRRGHGAALLAALVLEVARRGGDAVTLTTYADVPWNAPWYERHGWVELPKVPEHLRETAAAEEAMGLQRYGRRVVMTRSVRPLSPPGGSRS
jgi:GNAT superfamily N-acetyltransferase